MSIPNKSDHVRPTIKNILVIGRGGRENALAWGLSKSKGVEKVLVAPGNGGTESIANCLCLDVAETNVEAINQNCKLHDIDLVVIGAEGPLSEGLADKLRQKGIIVFGPGKDGAQLEASKEWAKKLMNEEGIPTAKHWAVKNTEEAIAIIEKFNTPLVVKVDGLAGGKGVAIPENIDSTIKAVEDAFLGKFGIAGERVILEEMLSGPEVSIFALCDGNEMVILPPAQDHKRLKEGDQGPNTGGMGAYAPAPLIDDNELQKIKDLILIPTLKGLKNRGIDYRGVIYAGLMLTNEGPKVIEFNCRFGDPECQTLIPLLGIELAEVLQACALGQLKNSPKLSIRKECSACVVAAAEGYPEAPRKGDSIKINLELDPNISIQLFHAGTERNKSNQLLTSGGRVFSLVTQGASFDQAFAIAYESMKKIEFKGINYRRDIGYQVRKTISLESD